MVHYDWLDVDVVAVAFPPLKGEQKTMLVLALGVRLAIVNILINW